ncbi:hypothetical protein N9934_00180 [Desulfosarcina sp.]|nr:hypothetical protein [Desulfosarcina sp.]
MMDMIVGFDILKLALVVLLSGVKFLFAPIISIGYGYNFLQTIILTSVGGILGLFFFYFLSKWIIRKYYRYCPTVVSYFADEEAKQRLIDSRCGRENKKTFTKKNKFIIKARKNYGFFGIILLTPVLFSIPIGAFLAQKYYSKNKKILVYLSLSVTLWSACLSSMYFLF